MYLIKTPDLIQSLFPQFTWKKATREKVLYLTFDDGPIPEITTWVLAQLQKYNAKATFFCVGDNIRRHPSVFNLVRDAGHSIGNHTNNHLNGWNTDTSDYLGNVDKCSEVVTSTLFRPPHGRLRPTQAMSLHQQYEIIMWDVLSGDFDPNITPDQCLQNVLNNTRKGSIIVFHDSLKASKNLFYALPRVLEHFSARGYRFEALQPAYVPQVLSLA